MKPKTQLNVLDGGSAEAVTIDHVSPYCVGIRETIQTNSGLIVMQQLKSEAVQAALARRSLDDHRPPSETPIAAQEEQCRPKEGRRLEGESQVH